MEPYRLTIHEAAGLLQKRAVSSQELTQAVLDRISSKDGAIGAYLTLCPEQALAAARQADQDIAQGRSGPLAGIPLAVKDVLCTQGVRTTCGSRILDNFIPPYDAHVVTLLKQAGAVIVGKTNMDEFAMGSSTENSAFYPTRNPWDPTRIPGGSSGGSAAAVAADLCIGSIGSDTGGSIRQPASHCGVVGLKPTYGRVSRFGLVAYASSLDQVGPITKDVRDCALLMNVLSGYDRRDSTSVPREVPDYALALDQGVSGLRVGVPKEYFASGGLDPDVASAVERAVKTLESLGARTVSVSLPHAKYAVAAYYIIAPAEASSNLARYDGVKYGFRDPQAKTLISMYHASRNKGFGQEVKRRILIGTYALSAGYYDAYYRKASQVRTLIREDFTRAFSICDVIVSPVAPTPAFLIGEQVSDPLQMYLSDIFTLSANLAGIPGISVPCGFSKDGLPIGLQIMASHFEEEKLLAAAQGFEQATDHHAQRPKP